MSEHDSRWREQAIGENEELETTGLVIDLMSELKAATGKGQLRDAVRSLIDALERTTKVQRRRGDVVEDCEGLSIAEQHDKEIGDLIEALKEALK